jgi:Leucine-rich repeat (LRR) protein
MMSMTEEPIEENLHDDPYYAASSKYHSSRRKWLILGATVFAMAAVGGMIGALTSRESGSADNSGTDDTPRLPAPPTVAVPTPAPVAAAASPAPTSEVSVYIRSILPDGGFSVDFVPDSYQFDALFWLEGHCAMCDTDERIRQRFVLACIYFATNAVRTDYTDFEYGIEKEIFPWLDDFGWMEADDECTWAGITCNSDGLVESIDMHDNLLTGKFPPETALLKDSLLHLDLENNLVYNVDEEVEWLGELINLKTLNIAQTPFEYQGIPASIGKLTNLVILDLSYTLFFGPLLPEVFADLNQVQYLYIGGNSYNSSIPETVGDMDNLLYFYAEFSDVQGDLSFVKNMQKIYELWVDNNPKMSGPIPSEIGNLKTLESLSLTGCGLNGAIPSEFGSLYRMQQMWLFGNQLNGAIPASLGNLTRMNRLELEDNQLEGAMPASVCTLRETSLEILEADCKVAIDCECCTCCGPECAIQAPKTAQGAFTPDGNRRGRRLQFVKEQRRRRRLAAKKVSHDERS